MTVEEAKKKWCFQVTRTEGHYLYSPSEHCIANKCMAWVVAAHESGPGKPEIGYCGLVSG